MTFLSRDVLWFLLAVPASAVAYILLLRRRTHGLRYTSLALVRAALGPAQRWRGTYLTASGAILMLGSAALRSRGRTASPDRPYRSADSKSSSAALANAYILSTRSLLPVSMISARSTGPLTAMAEWPGAWP